MRIFYLRKYAVSMLSYFRESIVTTLSLFSPYETLFELHSAQTENFHKRFYIRAYSEITFIDNIYVWQGDILNRAMFFRAKFSSKLFPRKNTNYGP